MNNITLLDILGGISDRHIAEFAGETSRPAAVPWKWLGSAACLALLLTALFLRPEEDIQPPIIHGESLPQSETVPALPPFSDPTADWGQILVNDLDHLAQGAPRYYDPAEYDHVQWSEAEILSYFGRDLTPAAVPDDLTGELHQSVVISHQGEICLDMVIREYAAREKGAHGRGFTLTASRLGITGCCVYILPENEVKTSEIGGIPVTIGHRPMPAAEGGFYDLYTAEFTLDGIACRLVSERMTLEEVVEIVASVIAKP